MTALPAADTRRLGILIGVIAGAFCQWLSGVIKFRLKVDDSLDVFAVHGGGGILGSLLVAVLVLPGTRGSCRMQMIWLPAGGRARVIIRRETIEDLLRREVDPQNPS